VRVALCIRQRILVGKPEGKRLLGRLRGRWKHDIKMELKEIEDGIVLNGLEKAQSLRLFDYLRR